MRAAQKTGQQEAAPVPFLNPDPITHLVGHPNEAPVIVDGQRVTTLIDLCAQVLNISSQFCEDLALWIQPLGRLFELEGTVGSTILYLRYVEVNLHIPGMKNYNKDVLLLVIPTTTYSEKVPVMVGSKKIDQAMWVITKGELLKATMTWKQAHFRSVMSRSLQLPHTSSNRTGEENEVIHFSLGLETIEVKRFCLDDVWDPVCTTQRVTIPLFGSVSINGNTSVRGHCMQVDVLAEPTPGP